MKTPESPIKKLLEKRGILQLDIARELGVHRSTISHVIYGHDSSDRVLTLIAGKLGLSIEKVKELIPSRKAA
jgi:transcriptional regulator with XRE-family HTH domain